MKITVAGVGYVGLSLAVLLAQNHEVTAITTTPAKAEKLNKFISPIQDDEIERFFREANAGERKLNLFTTVDKQAAYSLSRQGLHGHHCEKSCTGQGRRADR